MPHMKSPWPKDQELEDEGGIYSKGSVSGLTAWGEQCEAEISGRGREAGDFWSHIKNLHSLWKETEDERTNFSIQLIEYPERQILNPAEKIISEIEKRSKAIPLRKRFAEYLPNAAAADYYVKKHWAELIQKNTKQNLSWLYELSNYEPGLAAHILKKLIAQKILSS